MPRTPVPPGRRTSAQAWNRGLIPTMVFKLVSGQTTRQAINWAKDALEGFRR